MREKEKRGKKEKKDSAISGKNFKTYKVFGEILLVSIINTREPGQQGSHYIILIRAVIPLDTVGEGGLGSLGGVSGLVLIGSSYNLKRKNL